MITKYIPCASGLTSCNVPSAHRGVTNDKNEMRDLLFLHDNSSILEVTSDASMISRGVSAQEALFSCFLPALARDITVLFPPANIVFIIACSIVV